MFTKKIMVLLCCLMMTAAASASQSVGVPVGNGLGATLGNMLGHVLSFPLGAESPLAVGGVLMIATVSLAIGIRMVKRKTGK